MQIKKVLFFALVLLLALPQPLSFFDIREDKAIFPQTSFRLGEVLFISWDQKTRMFLDGKEFTYIKDKAFAGAGLYGSRFRLIHQFLESKNPFFSFWGQQEIIWQRQYVVLNKKENKVSAELRIPASRWKKLVADEERKKQDRLKIQKLYQISEGKPDLDCWQAPLKSFRVSKFAAKRTLPNGKIYHHSGVDLRARSPKKIRSVASGKVVLSEELLVPGNTLLIHHGGGFFSRYLHLSKFLVQNGQKVKRGQEIALTGGTGRVEAPHLHWEIIWKGNYVNPESFLKVWERICDPV